MRFEGCSVERLVGSGAPRATKRKHNEARPPSLFLLLRPSLSILQDILWADPGPNSEDQPEDRVSLKHPHKPHHHIQVCPLYNVSCTVATSIAYRSLSSII